MKCALLRPSLLVFSPADAAADAVEFEARGSRNPVDAEGIPQKERGFFQVPILGFFRTLRRWGWVKTLVPSELSEPQVIAGIYGCSSH